MEEVAREACAGVPLVERPAAREELRLGGRLHEVDRERGRAFGAEHTERRVLHRVDGVGRERGAGVAQQRPQAVGRHRAQPEELREGAVGDAAGGFHVERGLAVGDVAHGDDAPARHLGVGRGDRGPALLLVREAPDLAHRPGEAREAAALGNAAPQGREFEVAVGIDEARSQQARMELGEGLAVGGVACAHVEDAAPVVEGHERSAEESFGSPEPVRGYLSRHGGRIRRRRCGPRRPGGSTPRRPVRWAGYG